MLFALLHVSLCLCHFISPSFSEIDRDHSP
jgi:hypothetical protein